MSCEVREKNHYNRYRFANTVRNDMRQFLEHFPIYIHMHLEADANLICTIDFSLAFFFVRNSIYGHIQNIQQTDQSKQLFSFIGKKELPMSIARDG